MAYQKDTASTLMQAIDKFLAFCCLHSGYTRLADNGVVRRIRHSDGLIFNFDPTIRNDNSVYSWGNYFLVWIDNQPLKTNVALWQFNEPFYSINLIANSKDCSLILELNSGVFTELSFGKIESNVSSLPNVYFIQANGSQEGVGKTTDNAYQSALEFSSNSASYFLHKVTTRNSNMRYRSYLKINSTPDDVDSFKPTTLTNSKYPDFYLCGHDNDITGDLIKRSLSVDTLRHSFVPLYLIAYNSTEAMPYVAGSVHGIRPCVNYLMSPYDIIMDNWIFFPITSMTPNTSTHPDGKNCGYLFWTGD